MPWITRATISTPIEGAIAASSEPDRQREERGHEDALLARHVTDSPEDRRHDRRRQQVRSQHPGGGALRRVKLVLHRRQYRNYQRLQQRERCDAGRQDGECHLMMRTPTSHVHPGLHETESSFRTSVANRNPDSVAHRR
jgi:hypothetical protein